jgi:TolB-like protein
MAEVPTDDREQAAPDSSGPVAPGAGLDGVSGLLGRIREHKIVQWALAYVGAAITIAHGQELLAHAFAWNEIYARWLLALLLVGFPIALTLAWYHGHKGLTRVTQGEMVIGAILLVIGAGLFVLLVRPPTGPGAAEATSPAQTSAAASVEGPPPASPAPVLKPRIAVLPFVNLSPDPKDAFFTDGVHEEILTALTNEAPGLDVLSHTTMATYRGKPVTVQALARDLNCTHVLEGSVRREGDEVRLTVQLIDARNDSHLWAQNYDRKLISAMALESEVATAVAKQLSQRLAPKLAGAGTTADPLAYDLYLKARAAADQAYKVGSKAGLEQAIALLDQAIQRDASFVRAYLQRMVLRTGLFHNNFVNPDEALPAAQRDLETAQRLAPTDPGVTAYAAVLAFTQLDYARALALFESAEAAGVADPEVLDWKNQLLFAMGRYPEAMALSRRLAELDPKNEDAQHRWLYMAMEMHQYAEALRLADVGVARAQEISDWQEERAMVLFYAGGDLEPRRQFYAQAIKMDWHTAQDVQDNLLAAFDQLFLEHRFRELRALLDQSPVGEWRCTYIDWPLFRVGLSPIADIGGWTDLLLGDSARARQDGEKILEFLRHTPETRFNRWYRSLLRADAALFMGDTEAANRLAAESVAQARATADVSDQMNAYVDSIQVLAWTPRKAEAVEHLTELSTAVPGLWPGEIGGNPIYSVPLGPREDYRELVARLNEQMRALNLK